MATEIGDSHAVCEKELRERSILDPSLAPSSHYQQHPIRTSQRPPLTNGTPQAKKRQGEPPTQTGMSTKKRECRRTGSK